MQRSKQQALMFLLGAILVGGVLGFSADRVLGRERARHWAGRNRMYDDLALSEAQRSTMDSLLDERNCQIGAVMRPVRSQLDSIKKVAHQQMLQILTPAQQAKLELRRKEMERRDSLEKARRDAISKKTTNTCR
jgi:Spy/CpxP family protein refolding chaperone